MGVPHPASSQSSLAVTTDTPGCLIGQPIFITLLYEGPNVTVTFPNSCVSTFRVLNPNGLAVFTPVQVCLQVILTVTLTSGEPVGSFTWNQTDNLGFHVPIG